MDTIQRASIVAVPVLVLLAFSVVRWWRRPTASALAQLLGAIFAWIVILAHIAEAFDVWPSMGWGQPHSITAVRDNLELLLHRMGLEPIVLGNLPAAGDTIIEKLEHYIGEHGHAGFACVLLTPDDEGNKVGESKKKRYRARQNVVLELGMVLASLGRQRVAILYKQSVELPSDINGLIYIPFQEKVDEVKAQLFKELQAAGYNPNPAGL